jgi:glycosyltransferase involved in cell wall biosynthesis
MTSAPITLVMIVRNEAPVLPRALASVLPLLSSWCIVDTGSTDGTAELAQATLGHLPGRVLHHRWRDFGRNRSDALMLARGVSARASNGRPEGYLLTLDADETWSAPEGWRMPMLTDRGYMVEHSSADGRQRHWLTQLMRADMPWRYVGAVHEYAVCDGVGPLPRIVDPVITGHFDGRRNTSQSAREKYLADAALLRPAAEAGDARAMHYLAQSLRDAGERSEARAWYTCRAVLPGAWEEEGWWSQYQAALLCRGTRERTMELAVAFARRPSRAEPLRALARIVASMHSTEAASEITARADAIPYPTSDILFVDRSAYRSAP